MKTENLNHNESFRIIKQYTQQSRSNRGLY
uniref:Uncharacterized protein n=1 Tax=Anguilla anguilla TaxID=7936 RepID=A0A0E9P9S1_ANGAN